jgi:KaiC/GvpD/RAD55 family RecA-like ATPase
MTSPLKNPYGSQFQKHVVSCFVRLPEFYARFRGLLTEDVISDPDLAKIVATTHKICQDTGGQLPTKASLYEACPKSKQLIRELMTDDLRDRDHVAKKVGSFCQYKAVVAAVIDAGRKVKESAEKDEIDPSIVGSIQEAMRVGADISDVGEFLIGKDMEDRMTEYHFPEQIVRVPTGLTHLDQCMGGGLQPGELAIIIGAAKQGKSVLLAAIAHGAANLMNQKKVIYYSLEMKQRKILKRMDMRIAALGSDVIKSDPSKFTDALKRRAPQLMGTGNILVKSYPTRSCTSSMLCGHLSQTIAGGFKPDLIVVDYVDIMKPERRIGETHNEQAGCVEDLRRIAGEFNVAVWTACFPAGTMVASPRGPIAIEQIPEGYPVYSYDHVNKCLIVAKASAAFKTRKKAKLVRVDIDHGESVTCTPDHLFLLRDGTYVQAQDLKPGVSLMPFVRRMTKNSDYAGYTELYMCNGRFKLEHKVVGEYIFGGSTKGYDIHHTNEIKTDNSDLNLAVLTKYEHNMIHAELGTLNRDRANKIGWQQHVANMKSNNPMHSRATIIKMLKTRTKRGSYQALAGSANPMRRPEVVSKFTGSKNPNCRPEARERVRQQMLAEWSKRKHLRKPPAHTYSKDKLLALGRKCLLIYGEVTIDNMRGLGVAYSPIKRLFQNMATFKEAVAHDNHKVVGVVTLETREDVYDITVPGPHNFALAAGVFVHNCQSNRAAVGKAKPEISDIGYSYEKVQIADAIISIARSEEEKEQNLSRIYVNALRDEECGMIIKMHDDRKRMFMKTLEIVTESVKEKKEGSYGKSESEMDDRRLNKSRKLLESVKAARRKEAPIQS